MTIIELVGPTGSGKSTYFLSDEKFLKCYKHDKALRFLRWSRFIRLGCSIIGFTLCNMSLRKWVLLRIFKKNNSIMIKLRIMYNVFSKIGIYKLRIFFTTPITIVDEGWWQVPFILELDEDEFGDFFFLSKDFISDVEIKYFTKTVCSISELEMRGHWRMNYMTQDDFRNFVIINNIRSEKYSKFLLKYFGTKIQFVDYQKE